MKYGYVKGKHSKTTFGSTIASITSRKLWSHLQRKFHRHKYRTWGIEKGVISFERWRYIGSHKVRSPCKECKRGNWNYRWFIQT